MLLISFLTVVPLDLTGNINVNSVLIHKFLVVHFVIDVDESLSLGIYGENLKYFDYTEIIFNSHLFVQLKPGILINIILNFESVFKVTLIQIKMKENKNR